MRLFCQRSASEATFLHVCLRLKWCISWNKIWWLNRHIIYHCRVTLFTLTVSFSVCMIHSFIDSYITSPCFFLLFHFYLPPPHPSPPLSNLPFLSVYQPDLKQTIPSIRIESTQGFFLLKGSLPQVWLRFSKVSSEN